MPLDANTYNMIGKKKNSGLEKDFFFHLVINSTKVLPWALKRRMWCDVIEYAVNGGSNSYRALVASGH